MHRTRLSIPFLLALGLAAPALAQDDAAADAGDAAVSTEEIAAFKRTKARFQERMEELEEDTRAFVDFREREERARIGAGFDPKIETLETLESTHRSAAIAKMHEFLERRPDVAYASHVRFRLADLLFEEAKDEWLQAAEEYARLEEELGFERMDELPPTPKIDLAASIEQYQHIIDDNAGLPPEQQYEALDATYYMLGFSYKEPNSAQKDEEKARRAFAELIAARPDSQLADVAHLFLGNFHFDKNEFQQAIDEYRYVYDKGPEGLYYIEAMYQLAWTWYKLAGPEKTDDSLGPEAYDKALGLFVNLLDQSPEQFEGVVDYQPDAIKYVAISFFEVAEFSEQSPLQVAERYFARVGPREYEHDVYVEMADVLTLQARWDDAIAVHRKLQDDPRWRMHPANPDFQMQIVKLHASKTPPSLEQSAAARVELTDRYNSESEWWQANRTNPDALATARRFIEDSLADVAIEYRMAANASGAREDFLLAAAKFREYLDKFPISDDYYQQQFYLADTLYMAGEFEDAIAEYEALIRSQEQHPYDDAAAYFAMDAAMQLLTSRHGPEQVPESLRPPALVERAAQQRAPLWLLPRKDQVERTVEPAGGPEIVVYALSPDHRRFLEAADRLASHRFGEDEVEGLPNFAEVYGQRAHKVKYLAAQMLYFHNRFGEARPRLLALVDDFPHKDEGAFAAGLLVDSYQTEGDLAKVRFYTRDFMTRVLGEDEALVGQRQQQFASLLEGTAFKEALAFVEAGDREAAAEAFMAFAEEFPHSEHVPAALFNAGNSYDLLGSAERAIGIFQDYVRRYPDDPRSKDLYFRIADNYESTFDLEQAIGFYEELVERFPDDPEAPIAHYNAGFLRIGLGDHAGAARKFEEYAKRFPEEADAEAVFFQAGEQWELVGTGQAKAFYRDRYLRNRDLALDPNHVIEAKYKLATIARKERDQRRYDRWMDEVLADFDRFRKQGAELDWTSRHFAAESAIRDLKEMHADFVDDELTGDEARDLALLQEKKPEELVALEEAGLQMARSYSDFEYTTGALFLVAEAYLDYADLGFQIQPPPGLSPEEEDVYWEILETEIFPQFYTVQDKAVSRFEAIIALAKEKKQYSEWVGKAYGALNRLDPMKYPQEKLEVQGEAEAEITLEVLPMRATPEGESAASAEAPTPSPWEEQP